MLGYWWRYYRYFENHNENTCIRRVKVQPAVCYERSTVGDSVFLLLSNDASETEGIKKWKQIFRRFRICHRDTPGPPPDPTIAEKVWQTFFYEANVASREIISSAFASICSVLCSHPFDIVKEELQQKHNRSKHAFIKEWQYLYRLKGVKEFYRGHYLAQRESVFQTISMFYTFQRVHSMLEPVQGVQNHPNVSAFIAGFLSATFSVLVMKPLNTLREQREIRDHLLARYGQIRAAYTLRQKQNIYKLFKGCFANFMFQGTLAGLRFLIYNMMRDEILLRKALARVEAKEAARLADPNAYFELDEPEEPELFLSHGESLIAGAISGILGDLLVHPIDVLNTRLGVNALKRQLNHYEDNCHHYVQCMKLLYRKYKIRGLYSGFMPTLIRATVSTAVQFAAYEKMQEWLRPHFAV